MKKLINDPADVVTDALRGVAAAHPQLRVDHTNKVIFRGDAPVPGKVGIVSGGGSGPQPLPAGVWAPAADPATSLCTAGSWASACWTPRVRAKSSPRPSPTRSSRPRRAWTA